MIGLHTVGPRVAGRVVEATEWNLVCEEPAVRWERYGLEYTFVCFALERHPIPTPRPGTRPTLRSTLAVAAPNDRTTLADIPRPVERCESDGAR
jgi:hypothetical protein